MIRFLLLLIFWTAFFYLLFRLLRLWLSAPRSSGQRPSSVQDQPKKKSLDLSNADIEDAKFHEVKKK